MTVQRLVIDTSALIDSCDADHPAWGEAFRYLQGSYPAEAPHLLASETGQVVHVKMRDAFGATASERSEVLAVLLYGVGLVRSDEGSRARCGQLAQDHDLSFYDTEFLELAARDEGTLLVTQDRRLRAAARRHLGDDRVADLDEVGARIAAGTL